MALRLGKQGRGGVQSIMAKKGYLRRPIDMVVYMYLNTVTEKVYVGSSKYGLEHRHGLRGLGLQLGEDVRVLVGLQRLQLFVGQLVPLPADQPFSSRSGQPLLRRLDLLPLQLPRFFVHRAP
jgi:hypothetical protein